MRRLWTALLLVFSALAACRDVNLDHCLHRADDPDAWCARNVEGAPTCSPCAAEDHGCVAAAPIPDECPTYEPAQGTTTAATTDS
jgi:hypothetical protein